MILLTLASLAIVLLVVAIYNKLKDENISLISITSNGKHDKIIEGLSNTEAKIIADKEENVKAGSRRYDIKDDGAFAGLLTVKPGLSNWLESANLKDKKTKEVIGGGGDQPLKKLNEYKPKISLDATRTDSKLLIVIL